LAEAIRQYVSGRITNDDLDSVWVDWRDRGAVAVQEMAWQLYSDNCQHYVEDDIPSHSKDRRTVARWIVFLHSNKEYIWPEYSFMQIVNWPMNLLTFGWWERWKERKWSEFLEAGDFEVWPFSSRSELEEVAKRPKLLGGASSQSK
jgi:hypothetical protein